MDIVSFQQEGRWYGLFLGSIADLIPAVFIDSLRISSPILFGVVCYRKHSLLAVRIAPLLKRMWRSEPAPPNQRPVEMRQTGLLVVGRGEKLVGLPTESVACVLDVCQEPTMGGIAADGRGVRHLRVQYRDREITVLDASRLLRAVGTVLGSTSSGPGRQLLVGQPC